MKRRCPKCGATWELKGPVGFREECPECAAYMHTCTNCRHYDAPTRGCRATPAEPVAECEEMNFCEEFEYGAGETPSGSAPGPSAGKAAPPPAPRGRAEDEARRRFEGLFRDPKP